MIKEAFLKSWRKLLQDLRPMTWRQRLEHLWEYYKDYLWIASLILIFVLAFISSLFTLQTDVVVMGMIVNIGIEQEGYNYLSVDYADAIGAEELNQEVRLEYTNFESLFDPISKEDVSNQIRLVYAEVTAGMLDYMILDEMGMKFFIPEQVYMDLSQFFTPQEQEALGSKLITAMEEGGEEKWIVAVDITDTDFVKDNVTTEGKVYFALSGNTERIGACRDIWEYINQWESEE